MSSRNVRLESEDRSAAAVLNRALTVAQGAAYSHPTEAELRKAMMKVLEAEPRAKDISLDIVQADSLEPLEGPVDGPTAIMISARFGDVLLIDQKVVSP
jgi:pantoate--beta-alanine ligase